jgi:hypothetical protein
MTNHPSPATPAPSVPPNPLGPGDPLGDLPERFARWNTEVVTSPGVLSATRRSAGGRSIRCIVARSPGEMVGKLEVAQETAP